MSEILRAVGCLVLISGAASEISSRLFASGTSRRGACGDQSASSWGWSYLVGVAALSVYLYATLMFCGRITQGSFAAGWLGCGVLSGLYVARNWGPTKWWTSFRSAWWFDLPALVRCAALVVFIGAAWLSLFTKPTSFDGRAIFALKARSLFDQGSLQTDDFQDVDRVHLHAQYPLLIPLTEAELFWAQGSSDDSHLRLIFLGFVLALLSILAGEFRRYNSPRAAALLTAPFLGVPLMWQMGEGSGISAEADFPLACFATAGTLAMMQWIRNGHSRQAILSGLMFGAAAMAKDEGMLWAAAASLTLLIALGCRRVPLTRIASPAAWLGATVLVMMVLLVVGVRRQIPDSPYLRNYAAVFQWNWLRQLAHCPSAVAWYGLKGFFRTSKWNFIWPCVVAPLCLRRNRLLPAEFWCARVLAVIMAVSIWGIFVLTPYPIYWHLQTAQFRLCLQLLPLCWLLAVEQLSASGWVSQLSDLWTAAGNQTDRLVDDPQDKVAAPLNKAA